MLVSEARMLTGVCWEGADAARKAWPESEPETLTV